MRAVAPLLVLGVLVAPLSAQQPDLERPPTWAVRFDHSGTPDTAIYFVAMQGGWHVTTGPAAILYDSAMVTTGNFRIRATIFLFDPGQRHREAYGILLGGRNLTGSDQSYTYFLIRDTGDFLVKRRDGAATSVVRPWSASSAITKYPGGGEQARNVLTVEAGPDAVSFSINGERVTTVPRSDIQVEGIVGLRVNHSLNIHVRELAVEPL